MTACKDKLWFATAKAAKQKIKRLRNRTKTRLQSYHCPECGGYHMTSKVSMAYKMKARGNR